MKSRFNHNLEYLFLDEEYGETVIAYFCAVSKCYTIEYIGVVYRCSERSHAKKLLEKCTFIGVI